MSDNTREYYVYAIKSLKDSRVYVGFSSDVQRRLEEHNSGLTKSTKGYRPWQLVYCEKVVSRISAREREKFLKSGYGKELLKKLLISFPNDGLDCNKSFTIDKHLPVIISINS